MVAVTALANETKWWRRLWSSLGHPVTGPVPLYVDNRAATLLSDHAGKFDATKHMEVRYHAVRAYMESGDVKVRWVRGELQLADVLTKNVGVKQFCSMVTRVMGEPV